MPERPRMTFSSDKMKGMILHNCFYCDGYPSHKHEGDEWVVYCGNPDCEFKKKFKAPTLEEAFVKWQDYIYYDLMNPRLKERIQFWEKVQERAKQTLEQLKNKRN